MATGYDHLVARVEAQLLSSAVATAAGYDPTKWALSTAPHVFQGLAGSIGGRNRGRLPFIEFAIERSDFDLLSAEGGTLTSIIRVRVHVSGRTADAASSLSINILLACLAALRSLATDNYMSAGAHDDIGAIALGPFGHTRDATLTVEHTYDRSTYEDTGG